MRIGEGFLSDSLIIVIDRAVGSLGHLGSGISGRWWILWRLEKQMQNEKELIRLASAGVRGLFCFVFVWQRVST